MILSRSHAFIFVHVPKTAGMSVNRLLSALTSPRDIDICDPLDQLTRYYGTAFNLRKHSSASEIRSSIGQNEYDQLFKFGFVRHPYARSYSLFRFLKYNFREWENSSIMDTIESFDQFVESDFFQSPGPDRIFFPQCFWLCDDEGRLMIDRVGRTERLESDLRQIFAAIGLPPLERNLEAVNFSGGGGLSRLAGRYSTKLRAWRLLPAARIRPTDLSKVYANDRTRRIVAERYACDFKAFHYSTDLPQSVHCSVEQQ
jgi:hypothetical protein